ncbi:glycosyltransferase, partial [bacterium]|nr:glycosyltransferase [bacterium]
MRILYLTSGFPYPLLAGHLRYFHFMKHLAQRHEVTLFSLAAADFLPEHQEAMAREVAHVRTFPRRDRRHPIGRFVKEDLRLWWKIEPGIRELRQAVEAEVAQGNVDVVVISGKRVYPAVAGLDVPVVADICDAESERFRLRLKTAKGKERLKVQVGYRMLRTMEEAVVRAADRSLFASPRDRDALMAGDDPRGVIVPNGVDTAFWKRNGGGADDADGKSGRGGRHTIVFTGAMHYRPNADAAILLAREIFPKVRETVPDARLFVVGKSPAAELLACARDVPGVQVTGFVDDVRPYLEDASLFVAPLRYASGIQNKVLEAMAMELPVITSPAAADGLYTADGSAAPLAVAESTDDFVEAVRQRLCGEDEGAGWAPSAESRRFVEKHFS